MDRTVWNGTRFSGQYPPAIASLYENPSTTPDNLLLWFHHVPYTHRLTSTNETVIQHFYNAHYAGAATAQTFVRQWESLRGRPGVDEQRYQEVLFRLVYQAGHALVWRDNINTFYHSKCGIADEQGRVGTHPYRIEAENMTLQGYRVYDVHPAEAGSGGGRCVVTVDNSTAGTVSAVVPGWVENGRYDLAVNYYDLAIGNSTWEVFVDGALVGRWKGDLEYTLGKAPTPYIDGQTATRVTFKGVGFRKGSVLKIVGTPDGLEPAPLDYVSILPEGVVD
jgi:alpha-glucuronidase